MSRRVSPAVASKRANQEVRARFKAAREGKQIDPPAVHAGKLVAILTPAAASDPAPASVAYQRYVEASFADRYVELCRVAPIPVGGKR